MQLRYLPQLFFLPQYFNQMTAANRVHLTLQIVERTTEELTTCDSLFINV